MAGQLTNPRHRRRLLRSGLILALTLLVIGSWSWWAFVSPYAYSPPTSSVIELDVGDQRVFVYGTLRYPLIRRLILRQTTSAHPAILPDYRKQGLDIIKIPGEMTQGLVFSVSPQGLRRLDRYERVGLRYDRVRLTLADGEPVWVYRRLRE